MGLVSWPVAYAHGLDPADWNRAEDHDGGIVATHHGQDGTTRVLVASGAGGWLVKVDEHTGGVACHQQLRHDDLGAALDHARRVWAEVTGSGS